MADAIEVDDLHKSYGDLAVLQGLNLRVAAGEAFGLLGPNGAGKSTLIHLLLGFLRPNSGQIRVLGQRDPEQARARVGYVPERQRYHTRFSAREYLRYIGEFCGLGGPRLRDRVAEELRAVDLEADADRPMATYSKGMLQRVGIAQALLNDPELLLIDEPTSGLDPAGQREILDLLADVRARGHTIFFCTHYLAEVERLCDRVAVLAGGRLAAEARVDELRDVGGSVHIQVGPVSDEARAQIERLGPQVRCEPGSVRIGQNTPQLQAAVLRALLDANVAVIALDPLQRPLERLYLQAVGGASLAPPRPAPQQPPTPVWAIPPAEPAPPAPRRPGEGDTLLNELLGRRRPEDEPPPAEEEKP